VDGLVRERTPTGGPHGGFGGSQRGHRRPGNRSGSEMAFFVVLSIFPGLIVPCGDSRSLDFIMGEEVAADAQKIVIDFLSQS
jgi:hypothetical protein